MKKTVLWLLVMVMMVSLMACGGNTDPVGGVESTAAQTENSGAQQGQENADVTKEEPAETTVAEGTTEAPLFDNSWASNEYEAQLPELPFSWSVGEDHDPEEYLMKAKDVRYTDVKAYGEILMNSGFDIDLWVDDATEGGNYRIIAQNKNGYTIDYDFNAYSYDEPITGLLRIYVGKAEPTMTAAPEEETEGTAEVLPFDNSWASNEYEAQLPELPFEWSVGQAYDSDVYMIQAENVQYTAAKAYSELLMDCGFDIDLWVDDTTEGSSYRVIARNQKGYIIDYDFNASSPEPPITGSLEIFIEKTEP